MSKKQSFFLFFVGICSLAGLGYVILSFPPNYVFSLQLSAKPQTIPALWFFFLSFFIAIFALGSFVLRNKRRGFFISSFCTLSLFLQINHLGNLFFISTLLAIFVILELFFTRSK